MHCCFVILFDKLSSGCMKSGNVLYGKCLLKGRINILTRVHKHREILLAKLGIMISNVMVEKIV